MFNCSERANRWSLKQGKLIFHHPKADIFWETPEDFLMPSLPVLGLAEYVFLTPFKEIVELEPVTDVPVEIVHNEHHVPVVNGKTNVGVAFSGGIDSTAVL